MTNPGESNYSFKETDIDVSACKGKACRKFYEKLSAQIVIFGKWLGIVGDKGFNVKTGQEMVINANNLLEEGSYEEAIRIFFQAKDWLRDNSSEFSGFDTPKIKQQIATLTKREGSQEILEGLLEETKRETAACIEYTKRTVNSLKESKVHISESEIFLKSSEIMETRGRFPEARDMANKAMDSAFESLFQRIERLTEAGRTAGVRVTDKTPFKTAEGEEDTKTVYDFDSRNNRLKKLVTSGYHDEAVVIGGTLIDDLLEAIKTLRNDANITLQKAEESLKELEDKEIGIESARKILNKAREKAKENALLDCIDYVNIATNKATELENKHNEMKNCRKEADETIESLKKIGYDTASFEDRCADIEQIKDNDEAIAALKALENECSELYTSQFDDLEARIGKVEKYLQSLIEKGINVAEAMNVLEGARKEIGQGNYQEAKESLERSIAKADEIEIIQDRALKHIEEAKTAIEEAKASGVYIDDLLEKVHELEDLKDYDRIIEEARQIVSKAQSTRQKLKETASDKIKDVSIELQELHDAEINVKEAKSLIESALQSLEEEHLTSAIKLASDAQERAIAIKKTHEEMLGEFEAAGRIFEEIEVSGVDLADLRERMKDIKDEEDYAKALEAIRGLQKEARERRVGIRMNAMEAVEGAEKRQKALESKGVIVGSLSKSIQMLREKLEDNQFTAVMDEVKHFNDECEKLEEQFQSVSKGLREREEQILWLGEHKVEDLERFRQKHEEISKMEDYGKAIEMNNALKDELIGFHSQLREDAKKGIEATRKALEGLKSQGIVSKDAEESLEKAEKSHLMEFYPWAIKNAKNAQAFADISQSKYRKTFEKIKELEDVLMSMKGKGLDIDEQIDRLLGIRDEKDYDRAMTLIDGIKKEVMEKKHDLETKTRVFIEETHSLLLEAEKSGLNIAAALGFLEAAEEKLKNEDFLDAISEVEKARAEAEKSKTNLERLQGEIERIRKALGELESIQLDVSGFKSKVTELEELKDYDDGLDRAALLFKEIRDFRYAKEKEARGSIENMAMILADMEGKGIRADEVRSCIDKAEACMDKDYFEWAMGHINIAKKKVDRIKESHTTFMDELGKLESELETAKTTGIELNDIIDGLIALRERSDYDGAVESMKGIREKISQRENHMREEVTSLLDRQMERIGELKESGAATTNIDKMLEECNDLVEKGLLGNARYLIEEIDKLVSITKEDYGTFKQSINETNATIGRAEKAGIDTVGYVERLEEISQSTEYRDVQSLLEAMNKEMIDDIEALHKETQLKMVETFEHIEVLEDKGVRISEAKEIFDESVKLMQEERFTESKEKAEQAKEKADEIQDLDKEYNDLISRMGNIVQFADLMGINIEGMDRDLEVLKSEFTTYRESISQAKDMMSGVEKLHKKMIDECQKNIDSARKYLEGFRKKGVRTAHAEAILSQAEEKVASEDYLDVKGLCDSVKQKAGELQEQQTNLTDFLADLVKSKERAEDMDIDCSDIPDQIEAIERLDDYEQAIKLTIELIDTVERQIEGELNKQYEAISQDIGNRLSKLEKDVDRLSVTGIDVSEIRVELEKARDALEKRAFSEARKITNEAKTRYNKLSKELIDILRTDGEVTTTSEPGAVRGTGDTHECPGCTTMISADINFCPYCGFKLEQKRDVIDEMMQTVQARLSAFMEGGQEAAGIERIIAEAVVSMEHGRFDIAELKLAEAESEMDKLEGGTNLIKLPFTHGIETELQVVMNDGRWIMGSEMKKVFARIVEDSHERMEGIFKGQSDGEPEALTYIREKVKGIEIKKDKAKNDAVHVSYEMPDGTVGEFPVIGKDSHVTFETNILEIQTPPCQYLKELEWWLYTVFRLSSEAIEEMGIGLNIVSTGLNPVEEYVKGVSFGDHHHIGVKDEEQRIAAYNMLRNFLPHFIALSANSPFENATDKVVDIKFNPQNSIISRLDPLSIRLEKNTGQLALVPELAMGEDVNSFMKKIDRVDQKSARMVDLFPFTRFGTIELRYFDTQLSVSDRISYAVLLQALALKATKMAEKGESIPCITGENLKKLREKSLQGGLLSTYVVKDANLDGHPDFARLYQKERYDGNGKLLYMVDACTNMLYYISDELFDMNVVGSYYLDPVFVKLFGGKDSGHVLGPPITSAQFQLYLFDMECDRDLQTLVNELGRESRKAAGSLAYNPMIEKLGNPVVPEFMTLKGLAMEIRVPSAIIAPLGGSVRESFGKFGIMLTNEGKAQQKDIHLKYRVVDDKGGILEKKEVVVGSIPPDQDKLIQVKFPVRSDISSCSIECRARTALESITKTGVISVQRIEIGIAWIGAGSYITTKETVSIPYTMEILNELDAEVSSVIKITAMDTDSGDILGNYEKDVTLKAKDKSLYGSMTGAIADWAEETLKIQKYIEMPPLEITPSDVKNIKCRLHAELDVDSQKFASESRRTFMVYKKM